LEAPHVFRLFLLCSSPKPPPFSLFFPFLPRRDNKPCFFLRAIYPSDAPQCLPTLFPSTFKNPFFLAFFTPGFFFFPSHTVFTLAVLLCRYYSNAVQTRTSAALLLFHFAVVLPFLEGNPRGDLQPLGTSPPSILSLGQVFNFGLRTLPICRVSFRNNCPFVLRLSRSIKRLAVISTAASLFFSPFTSFYLFFRRNHFCT